MIRPAKMEKYIRHYGQPENLVFESGYREHEFSNGLSLGFFVVGKTLLCLKFYGKIDRETLASIREKIDTLARSLGCDRVEIEIDKKTPHFNGIRRMIESRGFSVSHVTFSSEVK